ncbi:uridine diphosphate glucose pyrophosphatase NUDT22 isoform X2 [Tamandua tetradactyla]|uniref:uridine diphosphate glucose pyrophosphatase NUDT22 isoform X2 n=1 Tax=Tamandua tetradactyla TaxID=48850 RepID=UPI00405458EB
MDPEVSLLLQCPQGGLPEEQVRAELSPAFDRHPLPGGDKDIAAIWEARLQAQPWLFDAPKFRLHSATLAPIDSPGPQLLLCLGLTSYREFLGTNWANSAAWLRQQGAADWGDRQAYLADPLGVGAALATADGFLVFLRRSRQVAEAPGLVDVPGGHPEPQALCAGDRPRHDNLPGELVVQELFSSVLQEICDEVQSDFRAGEKALLEWGTRGPRVHRHHLCGDREPVEAAGDPGLGRTLPLSQRRGPPLQPGPGRTCLSRPTIPSPVTTALKTIKDFILGFCWCLQLPRDTGAHWE